MPRAPRSEPGAEVGDVAPHVDEGETDDLETLVGIPMNVRTQPLDSFGIADDAFGDGAEIGSQRLSGHAEMAARLHGGRLDVLAKVVVQSTHLLAHLLAHPVEGLAHLVAHLSERGSGLVVHDTRLYAAPADPRKSGRTDTVLSPSSMDCDSMDCDSGAASLARQARLRGIMLTPR